MPRGLLRLDELRDVLRDAVQVDFLLPRRAARAQDAVDERGEPVRLLDDDARVRLLLGIRQLPLEKLRRAAQSAERILHLVRELANDAPRQPLLRDELRLAPHAAVALRVEELEDQRVLVVEQRHATVEHDLALADSRRELVEAEREPRRERALAQREQLLGRVHDVGERAPHRAPRADAEQILGRGVQIGDEQAVVEHDECRRQPLEDVIGARRAPRAPAELQLASAGELAPAPAGARLVRILHARLLNVERSVRRARHLCAGPIDHDDLERVLAAEHVRQR